MDLLAVVLCVIRAWFPRPRGDGPSTVGDPARTSTVSPPTRGWTRAQRVRQGARGGFPAHAGMDRRQRNDQRQRSRFPRPRGDGPDNANRAATIAEVSPPTRGWTRVWRVERNRHHGFPAHAGMDPEDGPVVVVDRGFPRPRGDGPTLDTTSPSRPPVSPPTRGWTLRERRHLSGGRGFPAHAGMDRWRTTSGTWRSWFPRPRGDGPPEDVPGRSSAGVSPPTRGWTAPHGRSWDERIGFPAHAGMDLRGTTKPTSRIRFPRPRGDGPISFCSMTSACMVSPPTRGWTPSR